MTKASAVLFGLPMVPDAARLAALTAEALSAGWLTNGGALHMRLEQALAADQADGDALSLVSSGTLALSLALMLGDLPRGSEVITTPLSFAATAQAIAWMGLVPVFADVEPGTLTLCPLAVERAITPRTSAIVPVHFLGVPCDVRALQEVADRHGLWLAYDAAQAYGVTVSGQPIGHFGDASAFSLHATKLLNTAEGGFVVTRADRTPELRRMRNFGLEQGRVCGPGFNGKMSELHAAMGLALLPDLPAEIAARRRLRQLYDTALDRLPGLQLHRTRPGASESLLYYTLRLAPERRQQLLLALAQERIFAHDHFPPLCGPGTIRAESGIVTAGNNIPNAIKHGPEVLCLPLHGRVSDADAERITGIIARVCQSSGEA